MYFRDDIQPSQIPPPPGDLLLNGFHVGLREQGEQSTAEVVGVAIGVAQLVGNGVEEEVATCTINGQVEYNSTKIPLQLSLVDFYIYGKSSCIFCTV